MTSDIFVSIVIPAFNCADYVEETFNSIKAQTHSNWEVIFVDDGSIDRTPQILEELSKNDLRVKVVQQINGKQGKARNNGISNAKGDWIAFLDADDIWPNKKLELQLEKTISAQVDMSFTNGFICLDNDMSRRDTLFGVEDSIYKGSDGVQKFHLQNRVPTSTVLVKKAAILAVSMFPEQLEIQNCEDYLLWTSLLNEGFVLMGISEPLLYYRVHSKSSTGQEVKLLFPLLKALLRMPGAHSDNLNTHLKKTFFRFLTLLAEQNRLNEGKELILKVIPHIFPTYKAVFLKILWIISTPIGLRLTWRLS
jgi:teichuronic acid biosynthesis glycosyltransferase TuaG